MTSSTDLQTWLNEKDVPGAALYGRDPSTLTIPQLKRWLECRKAPTKGKKADLVARVKAYIRNGWENNVINPDYHHNDNTLSHMLMLKDDSWKELREVFSGKDPEDVFTFTNAQMISYFVVRMATDGNPASDVKAMNKSALNLFQCGHIQDIMVYRDKSSLHFKAKCMPEMRKDRLYKLFLYLDAETYDIMGAECGCPAGKAPYASCKHIGAMCYALEEFSRFGRIPGFLTCTERLQCWNKPREKKLDIIPVSSLSSRKCELMKQESSHRSLNVFDPRQPEYRKADDKLLEEFRCNLLTINQPCAFFDILIPPIKIIDHDHTYAASQHTENVHVNNSSITTTPTIIHNSEDDECPHVPKDERMALECLIAKLILNVTSEERLKLERDTRNQSSEPQWHSLRSKRITGSKCGRILCQKKITVALITYCLYPKPLDPLPLPIAWGQHHESTAIQKYIACKKKVTVEKCGFIIHPKHGWLGASPDGCVVDTACDEPNGIVEIKCPYSKRDVTPEEACKDINFYCEFKDSCVTLKPNHSYYHQVQLQLYVGSDLYKWCDFCVYTTKGLSIQRILPDPAWQSNISKLESFYDNHMLPEIICAKYKPGYIL